MWQKVLARLDALDARFSAGPPRERWDRQGGPGQFERWVLERPAHVLVTLYGGAFLLLVLIFSLTARPDLVALGGTGLLMLVVGLIQYRAQRGLREEFKRWKGEKETQR